MISVTQQKVGERLKASVLGNYKNPKKVHFYLEIVKYLKLNYSIFLNNAPTQNIYIYDIENVFISIQYVLLK